MIYEGYKYIGNGKRQGIKYFKCSQWADYFCKGSLKQTASGFILIKEHNHNPDNEDFDNILQFKESLKERARNESGLLKSLYLEESLRFPQVAVQYPWTAAENLMRRARQNSLPTLPRSIRDLADLFENGMLNRYTCCQLIFKSYIRDTDGHSSIIFACQNCLNEILQNNIILEIHADATFKVVPSGIGARQLLVIHCMIGNHSIPILYALMESKTRASYDSIIYYMTHSLIPNINPTSIITDFETALRDSLVAFYPNAQAHGCWFHHNQAVWKKMKKLGFLPLINNNERAMKIFRMLLALPLLPPGDMIEGYNIILVYAEREHVRMGSLFEYYQRFWLQRMTPNFVSVHGAPRRTNNNIESFHNALRIKFSTTHPNLWIFIQNICDLSKSYHNIVSQLNNGLRPTRSLRSKFLANTARIRNATSEYDTGLITTLEFLNRCSYSMSGYERRQRNWALHVERIVPEPEQRNNVMPEQIQIDASINLPVQAVQPNIVVEDEVAANIPVVHRDNVERRPDLFLMDNEDFIEHHPEPQLNYNENRPIDIREDIVVRQEDGNNNLDTCKICLITDRRMANEQFIMVPCGHGWICENCKNILESGGSTCFVCRSRINMYLRVYL